MQAETFIEVNALVHVIVAALAAALVAVSYTEGHTIVAGRNDPLVLRDDSTVASLHAI